jgi:hypothetical protein
MDNLVREERSLYGGNTEDRSKFDIKKIKEDLKFVKGLESKKNILLRWKADYQQEFVNQKNAAFIKQIDIEIKFLNKTKNSIDHEPKTERAIFDDSAAQLGNILAQLLKVENKKGLVFRGYTASIIKAICNAVTDKDGNLFTESTITRNITKFNAGALSKKNKIDLSLNLDFDPDEESP